MDILPAIDLRHGRVVRLSQGEAARETVYETDAVAQAERFADDGARWLHVVDLDRAFGDGDNLALVERIAAAVRGRLQVQCGGGFRDLERVRAAVEAGVSRVVIGTAAVSRPELVQEAVAALGAERIAVGLDAREGRVALRGWTEQSALTVDEVAGRMLAAGVRTLVYTDIARDGMLTGPDLDGCARLAALGAAVIASGGFAGAADVAAAARRGCAGAILGRALYERRLTVPEALAAARAAGA